MKGCEDIKALMTQYIDGELNEENHMEFEEHVNKCEACSKELDEVLSVVALLGKLPEEEIPERFSMDLHNKLIAQKQKEDKRKEFILIGNKYLRVCTSIAAVLLITIFLRGMYNNMSITDEGMSNQSSMEQGTTIEGLQDNSIKEKQKSEGTEKKSLTATADNTANQALKSNDKAGDPAYKIDTGAERQSVKSDNTVERGIEAKKKNLDANASNQILNSNSNIVFIGEDSGTEVNKLKSIIAENGGEPEDNRMLVSNMTFFDSYNAEINSFKAQAKTVESTETLYYKVPVSKYPQLENALKTNFDSSRLQIGTLDIQDLTETSNNLNSRIIEIDNKINTIENDKSVTSTDELNGLKSERDSITKEVENIINDSDYIIVTITIKGK